MKLLGTEMLLSDGVMRTKLLVVGEWGEVYNSLLEAVQGLSLWRDAQGSKAVYWQVYTLDDTFGWYGQSLDPADVREVLGER